MNMIEINNHKLGHEVNIKLLPEVSYAMPE